MERSSGVFLSSASPAVGAERGGDAQGAVLDEGVGGGVPGGVAPGLKGGAQAAGGEAGRVRLALDQLLAGKLHDDPAVVRRGDEAVVLFGRDAGHAAGTSGYNGSRPCRQCPVLHGSRPRPAATSGVRSPYPRAWSASASCRYVLGKTLPHDSLVKDHAAEQLRYIFRRIHIDSLLTVCQMATKKAPWVSFPQRLCCLQAQYTRPRRGLSTPFGRIFCSTACILLQICRVQSTFPSHHAFWAKCKKSAFSFKPAVTFARACFYNKRTDNGVRCKGAILLRLRRADSSFYPFDPSWESEARHAGQHKEETPMLQKEGQVRIPAGCAISGIFHKDGTRENRGAHHRLHRAPCTTARTAWAAASRATAFTPSTADYYAFHVFYDDAGGQGGLREVPGAPFRHRQPVQNPHAPPPAASRTSR